MEKIYKCIRYICNYFLENSKNEHDENACIKIKKLPILKMEQTRLKKKGIKPNKQYKLARIIPTIVSGRMRYWSMERLNYDILVTEYTKYNRCDMIS